MKTPRIVEGHLKAEGRRFALLAGRFNSFIVDQLVEAARSTRSCATAPMPATSRSTSAPGGWELPIVAQRVAATGKYDAIIALGAVIRGSTPHFEYVAGEATKGLAQVGMQYRLPVSFGLLTVDTIEQAIERAGTKAGNKGGEAALAAIEVVDLFARMNEEHPA
jgi:6,7-dimethyl-8-ribityllumazine synthase